MTLRKMRNALKLGYKLTESAQTLVYYKLFIYKGLSHLLTTFFKFKTTNSVFLCMQHRLNLTEVTAKLEIDAIFSLHATKT